MRTWPDVATVNDGCRRSLVQQTAWADKMLRAAIVMAMYLNEMEKPTFLDRDVEYVRQTFHVELERWA